MTRETLDVTNFSEVGEQLVQAIQDLVEGTDSLITVDLPNKLLVTKEQFDGLEDEMSEVDDDDKYKGRLYFTTYNAMDVVIA